MSCLRYLLSRIVLLVAVAFLIAATVVNASEDCICASGYPPLSADAQPPCYASIVAFLQAGEYASGEVVREYCRFGSVASLSENIVSTGSLSLYTISGGGGGTTKTVTFEDPLVCIKTGHLKFDGVNLRSNMQRTMVNMKPLNGSTPAHLTITAADTKLITNITFLMKNGAVKLFIQKMIFEGSSQVVVNAQNSGFHCKSCLFQHDSTFTRATSFINVGLNAGGTVVLIDRCNFKRLNQDQNAFMAHSYIDGFSCAKEFTVSRTWLSINGNRGHHVHLLTCPNVHVPIPVVKFSSLDSKSEDHSSVPLTKALFRVQGGGFGPEVFIENPRLSQLRDNSIAVDGLIFSFEVEQGGRIHPLGFGFKVTRNSDSKTSGGVVASAGEEFNDSLATFWCTRNNRFERRFKALSITNKAGVSNQKQVVVGCQRIYSESQDIHTRVNFPFQMMEPLREKSEEQMWSVWYPAALLPSQKVFSKKLGTQSWDTFRQDAIDGAKWALKWAVKSKAVIPETDIKTFIVTARDGGSIASFTDKFNLKITLFAATHYTIAQTFKGLITPDNINSLVNKSKTSEACQAQLARPEYSHLTELSTATFCMETYQNQWMPFYIHNGKKTKFGGDIRTKGQVFIGRDPFYYISYSSTITAQLLYYDPDNLKSQNLAILYAPSYYSGGSPVLSTSCAVALLPALALTTAFLI